MIVGAFYLWLFVLLLRLQNCSSAFMPTKHFWIELKCLCVHTITWAFACHRFIHAYSPHISFNFLHILSFSSASYTLCEYECVCQSAHTVHFPLSFSSCVSFCLSSLSSSKRSASVLSCLSAFTPSSTFFLAHIRLLFLVLLTQIFPFSF